MEIKTRTFKVPFQKVYDASVEALRKSGFQIKDKSTNKLKASSGWDFRSWGENIEVTLEDTPRGVEVRVTSTPIAQLFDWGRSEENISKFFTNLERCLSNR